MQDLHVSTEQLLQIIGQKQVEIEALQSQLRILVRGYQEAQVKIADLEGKELVEPGEVAVIQVSPKKGK